MKSPLVPSPRSPSEQRVQQVVQDELRVQRSSCHRPPCPARLSRTQKCFLTASTCRDRQEVFLLLLQPLLPPPVPPPTPAASCSCSSSLRGGGPNTTAAAVTVSDFLTAARCETPPLQELIHHLAGTTTALYLPPAATPLQTALRFILVTSLELIHAVFNHSAARLCRGETVRSAAPLALVLLWCQVHSEAASVGEGLFPCGSSFFLRWNLCLGLEAVCHLYLAGFSPPPGATLSPPVDSNGLLRSISHPALLIRSCFYF